MIENCSFCSLPNSVAQDKNLSLKAKGLYLLIQSCIESHESPFGLHKPSLMEKCKEGSDAFDSTWKELKKAGYLKQRRISHGDSESKGFHYEYEFLDAADDSTPSFETLKSKGKNIPLRGRTE